MNPELSINEKIKELQGLKEKQTDILRLGTEILCGFLARKTVGPSTWDLEHCDEVRDTRRDRLEKIWRDVLIELYHQTECVRNQRMLAQSKNNKNIDVEAEVGKAIFDDLGLNEIINEILERKTDEEGRKRQEQCEEDITRLLNIKKESIGMYLYLGETYWAKFMLRSILFSIIFRAVFVKVYGRIESITEEDGDRNPIYFDGKIEMGFENTPFYLRLLSIGLTGAQIINNAGLDLSRIPTQEKINALVFVPYVYDPELLRAECHWRVRERKNLRVLYLSSFFDIFRIWENEGVRHYLNQEAIT